MTEQLVESPGVTGPCMPRELVSSVAFLLARLGHSIKAQAVDEFESTGLLPYHFSVLAVLDEGARETQATIADALNVDRSTLVGLLDTLEEQGAIARRRDPNDRRRHLVSLTPSGRRQLKTLRKLVTRIENEILEPLDDSERQVLQALLLKLASHRDERFVTRSS